MKPTLVELSAQNRLATRIKIEIHFTRREPYSLLPCPQPAKHQNHTDNDFHRLPQN